MKKILISENSEKANAFISELESVYLSSVSAVNANIQALGVEVPSKKFLFDVIRGDLKALQAKYEELTTPDIEAFKSPITQAQMKRTFDDRFDEIRRTVEELFHTAKEINNRRLNDKYFEQFIDLDESGKPYISDESKASIIESFKEYIDDPKEEKMYLAQHALAKALNDFVAALHAGGISSAIEVFPHLFLRKYFKMTEKENGSLEISAVPVNYKLMRP
ncbi:hypothetical protein A9168_07480 [Macellibacteroides sp. HH-ZS]|nr:hypothetical protein A9168_07480 [Macellibacteroides sp. HH-ZS]